MTEFRLVPVEATDEMVRAGYNANDIEDAPLEDYMKIVERCVNAASAAAPEPGDDVVEMVARHISVMPIDYKYGSTLIDALDCSESPETVLCDIARAILDLFTADKTPDAAESERSDA